MSTIEQIRQTAAHLRAELASPDAPPPTLEEARALAEAAIVLVEENARLTAVAESARSLIAAADACDREAERHPSSRSSAPVVRLINVMARLRHALDGAISTTCPECRQPVTDVPPDEKPRPDVIPEHHDCMFPARGARWTLPEPAERKPVAGWAEDGDDGVGWALGAGAITAFVKEIRGGARADLEVTDFARAAGLFEHDRESAQLAAEDALFAIADAINALRPGAVEGEVVTHRALVAELQKTNEIVSADRVQCAARVAELEARLTAEKKAAAGNERIHLETLADLHGLEGRLLRSVGATHVADSDRWRWPGEEQAFNGGAAVERALSELRAAFDGAAKTKAENAALMARLEGLEAEAVVGERIRQRYYRLRKLKVRVVDEKALAQVSTATVEAYLGVNPKWKRLAPAEPFFIWQHAETGDCCAIPREQTFADYGRRMLECLEAIAMAEERSQLGVLVDLWGHESKQTEPANEPNSNEGDA